MPFIKTLWSDAIYAYLYEDKDLNSLFDRSLETLARQGGNKITLPTLATGAAMSRSDNQSVGSGLPRTPADISKSSMDLDIYEYSTDPIVIRNLDVVQGDRALFNKSVAEVGQIIKEFILKTVFTDLITNVDATHKKAFTGSSGAKFTYSDLKNMNRLLNDAKILNNNRIAMLSNAAEDNLFDDSALANWYAVNQSAIQKGELPMLAGFQMASTALMPLTNGSGAIDVTPGNNVKPNVLAWRKDYVHLVIQTEVEIIGGEDARYLGGVYAFSTRFGTKLERAKAAAQRYQA